MSLEYIRKYYKVPADTGRVVKSKIDGRMGRIVGAKGAYVKVRPIDDSRGRHWIYHPTDLEYQGMDNDFAVMLKMMQETLK